MMEITFFNKKKIIAILALLSSIYKSSISGESELVNLQRLYTNLPGVSIPFNFNRAGHVVTADFNINNSTNKKIGYSVDFIYWIKSSNTSARHELQTLLGFFDKNNGVKIGDDGKDIYTRVGPQIPVRITISQLIDQSQKTVYDEKFNQYYPGGGTKYTVEVNVDTVFLETGLYRVRVESLGNTIPELANSEVSFEIHRRGGK